MAYATEMLQALLLSKKRFFNNLLSNFTENTQTVKI